MFRSLSKSLPGQRPIRANRWRFTLGRKLGLLTVTFATLWSAYAGLAYLNQQRTQAFFGQVREAASLRLQAERIAHLAAQCNAWFAAAHVRAETCGSTLRQSLSGYERSLAAVEASRRDYFLAEDEQRMNQALVALGEAWDELRHVVESAFGAQADRSSTIEAATKEVVTNAETLVGALVEGQQRAQAWCARLQNGLQLLGLLLLTGVSVYGFRYGVRPLRSLVLLNRRALNGDYSGRLNYRSGDEIGELIDAFNAANARTETLIGELEAEAAAARRAQTKSAALLESAADGIVITDLKGRILRVNREAERIFGYAREELIGLDVGQLIPERFHELHQRYVAGYARRPTTRSMGSLGSAVPGRRRDGGEVPLEISLSPVLLADDAHVIAVVRDASARLRAESGRQRLLAILDSTPDVVATFKADGELVYLNPAGRRLIGLGYDDPIAGAFIQDLVTVRNREVLDKEALPIALSTGFWSGELSFLNHSGLEVSLLQQLIAHPRSDGEPRYLSAVGRDISERKQYEQELAYQATHDQLTGLANRTLFEDRLEQAIHHARRNGTLVAVMFIDLDNFKLVNDSMGHAVGDRLLGEIARRLQTHLREGDTKARLGGDEFAVILEDLSDPDDAVPIVRGLSDMLRRPIHLNGQEFVVTASIGIGLFPIDGCSTETLLMHADIAMYQAKAAGRNSYCFYSADMNEHAEERLSMEQDLRHTIERGQLELFYQPVVSGTSEAVIGCEALLRWRHPSKGLIPPDQFIPVAEESGLIVPIGEWVIRGALKQLRVWRRAGLELPRMAVNVSAKQLRSTDLFEAIRKALADTEVEGEALEVELTEGSILHGGGEAARDILEQIRALGVKLVADDFGTGYSSLSYLKVFRFDKVKIDRSFVRDVPADPGDAAITRAIIAMARAFEASVVAEGVETEEQARLLQEFGCNELQGYLYSRPLPAEEFEILLGRRRVAS